MTTNFVIDIVGAVLWAVLAVLALLGYVASPIFIAMAYGLISMFMAKDAIASYRKEGE